MFDDLEEEIEKVNVFKKSGEKEGTEPTHSICRTRM